VVPRSYVSMSFKEFKIGHYRKINSQARRMFFISKTDRGTGCCSTAFSRAPSI
jgi:hypothetical protein